MRTVNVLWQLQSRRAHSLKLTCLPSSSLIYSGNVIHFLVVVVVKILNVFFLPRKFQFFVGFVSASLPINIIERKHFWNRVVAYPICRSVGLSDICWSVQRVYCGKTADWIQMLFGVVSGIGQGMGLLDGGSDRQRGRGSFGVEFVPLNPRFQRYVVCMAIL